MRDGIQVRLETAGTEEMLLFSSVEATPVTGEKKKQHD
jgi:hypothetical protein